MDADNKPVCAEVRHIVCAFTQSQGKEEPVMDQNNTARSTTLKPKPRLTTGPSPEEIRELWRLRAIARQKKDEASRQAVITFAMQHGMGEGTGTILG
jgi:hypothetical protein